MGSKSTIIAFMTVKMAIRITMIYVHHTDTKMPSYGEMIDLLSDVEKSCIDVPETLCTQFRNLYPHIPIGRPDRFHDTVQRLAAPTRPSLRGPSRLQGSPLVTYRKRIWNPKINNKPKGIALIIT